MKDFTPTQKLLMALVLSAAVTFAVLLATPAQRNGAVAHPAAPATMLTPF
jgi:hypothetical protein